MQTIMDRFLDWVWYVVAPLVVFFIIYVVIGILLMFVFYLLETDGAWLV